MTIKTDEISTRVAMFNSFMSCPHRDFAKIHEIHKDLSKKDPLFYARLASWYFKNGDIRDHQECFSAFLCTSEFLQG